MLKPRCNCCKNENYQQAPHCCSFTPCVKCGHYKESHKNFGYLNFFIK